ncbi:hypothetical protein DSCA_57670 [Desulfosarcina alkanivorans]|uniref:Uncharacterized protein n=1 Tax=Desulfosarcina alkanivorans TaxID=571177 RepID=A0A5K7Z5G8_9BACT|nr:hypothetical protein [Desulfosarcina alkanivorans]BBO71837.1 hypothetical protein DSCA_57670 [Desulfosarcina alkanivorans]
MKPVAFFCRTFLSFTAGCLLFLMAGSAIASEAPETLPPGAISTLHYLLDLARTEDGAACDAQRIAPLMAFLLSPKPDGALYRADDSFDAPSAYNEFTVHSGVQRITDYILDADIPSFFFWPSSLRLSRWTRVEGGDQQFARLKSASTDWNSTFILKGTEHITITPDQHTGAYYSYDVDRMVILGPYQKGKVLINIYRQQKPSAVGRKGWVLGKDDEWNYLYTRDKGLNVKGLGWADTYMYDSFGITVYYQADPGSPAVTCGTVSWVKAGWAGINMVKSKHIHRGLVRVAHAFTAVMEDPRLPEPAQLAETFSKSKNLPTPTLRAYARDYLSGLEQRIASSEILLKKIGGTFDSHALLEQMTRDELYAVLALDYFKKILGHNPVMSSHPF